jgi:CRP-like cAMP-binding protein
MQVAHPPCGNLLLGSLAEQDYELLAPHLERVPFAVGDTLSAAGGPIEKLCFPEGGVASLHDVLEGGERIGIGILGREGFSGWQVLLGSKEARHEVVVALPAETALQIDPDRLLQACDRSPRLRALLLRFVHTLFTQMGRTIVSNLHDPAERRLARWLLMNHDRIEGEAIAVTHQQLGIMLGVRRATVTDSLHVLEGNGLIRATRGQISVRDREGLKAMAGETYGQAEAEYCALVAPFGKDLAVAPAGGLAAAPPL